MLQRKGRHRVVVNLLEPLVDGPSAKNERQARTQKMAYTTLVKSYRALGEMLKEATASSSLQALESSFPRS